MATSQSTSYNPRGNGQCEKYNDRMWNAVLGALKFRRLPVTHREHFMTDAGIVFDHCFAHLLIANLMSVCFAILVLLLVVCPSQVG